MLEPQTNQGSRGRSPSREDAIGRRRKQEGVVYTPAFITRCLVEQALGGVLKARFETCNQLHAADELCECDWIRVDIDSQPAEWRLIPV